MSLIVKICGLSEPETLEAALDAGADMVGLVFFEPSPRNVDLARAAELAARARGRAEIAALTVDADAKLLDAIAEQVRPDWFQLHGDETPEAAAAIRETYDTRVMKAIAVAASADLGKVAPYASVVDRILFDARAPKDATRPGGLGVPFDWHLLEGLNLAKPFVLSGGLNLGNLAQAVRIARPHGVDVSSGVERALGVKDANMIRAFIGAARGASSSLPLPVDGERSAFKRSEKAG
jgi:phosphoribosylanthranilate isomerase